MRKLANAPKIQISSEMAELLRGVFHHRLEPRGVALTYLASRALGLVRYPTRPDRSVDHRNSGFQNAVAYLDSVSEEKWDLLGEELVEIKRATAGILANAYQDSKIELVRFIELPPSPSFPVPGDQDDHLSFTLLAEAARLAGLPSITIDVDILSGWSEIGSGYYGNLRLSRDWPISEILLVSDLLTCDGRGQPLEDDEWICINRQPTGLMHFPTKCVTVEKLPEWCSDRILRKKAVADLARELQQAAYKGATLREIALRPNNSITRRALALTAHERSLTLLSKLLRRYWRR
ncbi:hypothetical protein ACCT13_21070 [Rhizobium ruizarguesonis]